LEEDLRSAGIVKGPLSIFADKLISIRASIGEREELNALVDPGSYLNLLDTVLAKELGLKWKALPPNFGATAVNSSSITIYGVTEVNIVLSDSLGYKRTLCIPFLVANLKRYPIYLGILFVSDVNLRMDFTKKELYWRPPEEEL
jgi:hypothetical protein